MVQLSTWVDLWDQSLGLVKQSESGLEVHQRLHKFLLEFGKLQTDTFAAQRKLCNKYIIDNEKVFGMENSYGDAFNEFLRIVHHAVAAESLISTAFGIQADTSVSKSVKEEKMKLKVWKADRTKLFSEMKSQVRIIDDEIKRYRDKYRDMVKANDEYARIDADRSASRIDVDKALLNANQKKSDYERARDDYSAALNQFNIYRRDYFSRILPNWSQAGYNMAAERYNRTRQLLSVLHERVRVASERMKLVARELQEACSTHLLLEKDTVTMVEKLRSGYPPPSDIAFVDLCTLTSRTSSMGPTRGDSGGRGAGGSSSTSTSNNSGGYACPEGRILSQRGDADELSTGPIYATTSLPLPADFHGSVSAADVAGLEAAGLPPLETSGYAYPEAVLYAALVGNASLVGVPVAAGGVAPAATGGGPAAAAAGGGGSYAQIYRKNCSTGTASSAGVFGAVTGARSHLFQRFFSRRLKHTNNSPELSDCAGAPFESNLPWRRSQHKLTLRRTSSNRQPSTNGSSADMRLARSSSQPQNSTEDLTSTVSSHHTTVGAPLTRQFAEDSSDFSDSSLPPDNENEQQHHQPQQQSAYADTSVLAGLPEQEPNNGGRFCREDGPPATLSQAEYRQLPTTAPLARPESPSLVTNPAAARLANGRLLARDPSAKPNGEGGSAENNNRHDSSSSSSLIGICQRSDCVGNNQGGGRKFCAPPRPAMSPTAQKGTPRALLEQPGYQRLMSAPREANVSEELPPPVAAAQLTTTAGEGDITRHFFPRQAKVRTSSTADTAIVVGQCTTLYAFTAEGFESCYFAFEAGDTFHILAPSPAEDTTDWLRVLHCHSYKQGYVPTAYVEQYRFPQPHIMPIPSTTTGTADETTKPGSDLIQPRCPASPSSCSQASNREYIRKKVPYVASRLGNLSTPLQRFPSGSLTQDTEL